MVAVPRDRRVRIAGLWMLAERLTALLRDAREPLIGQIKLAWWRDMMVLLASDPAALPKGEPLLAELQASWAGQDGLAVLVDAAEAMLSAEDAAGRHDAATGFGEALFRLSGGGGGARWGLLWGAALQDSEPDARALFAQAAGCAPPPRAAFGGGGRALRMLDRWAAGIAARGGARDWRREGLLLFRIGLIGI
jgi:phytoene synthase